MNVKVAKTRENLKKCKCMHCPSYTTTCKFESMPENLVHMMENLEKVDHFEGMFCAFEKSKCINKNQGCLCSGCKVYRKYDLNKEDYCLQTGGM